MDELDYLLKDENILNVEVTPMSDNGKIEEGVLLLVGGSSNTDAFELAFTETDLINMLQTVTGCDVEIKE